MKNKKILLVIIIVILIILLGGIITFSILDAKTKEQNTYKYTDFLSLVDESKIDEVTISENEISFKLKDDNKVYYTTNPDTNDFKEMLLLKDIDVENDFDAMVIVDVLFYAVFFIVMGCVVIKFIQLKGGNFKVIRKNNTRFSDIAGLDELKNDMLKSVEVLKNIEEYKKKGIRPPNGILLEGDPGNGKTLFAKALAGEANINFIATKATDFQSAVMSIGPSKIKALFKKARKNAPCIIFIDEIDGIGERRNYSGTGIDKENNRIITAMLNEMDGFTKSEGVMVIGATNSFKSLDPALVRPGRFDKKYEVTNPDLKAIVELIKIYSKNKNVNSSIDLEKLAFNFQGMNCAQIETIINEAATISLIKNHEFIELEDFADGIKKICNVKNVKLRM